MNEQTKQMIARKIEDVTDELHDLYCTLHETGVRVSVHDFIQFVYPHLCVSLDNVRQDLCDEFDENPDEPEVFSCEEDDYD